MPSGKKSKQLRRAAVAAPPPVVSKGGTRRRQANPKVLAAGAVVVVLAVVAIVLGVVLSGGGGSNDAIPKDTPTVGTLQNALPGAAEVQKMYKGIPQDGFFLGSPFAPAQMVIYIDLQCPICQNYETTAMPTLVSKYVRAGKLRIEVKPWAFIGEDSFRGQAAMIAAAQQDKAWNFASILYLNQGTENTGWLDDAMIAQAAASVPGMKVYKLLGDRSDAFVKKTSEQVDASAAANAVTGTPTVFVGKSGAKPQLVGAPGASPDLQQTETAVNDALSS